MLFGAETAIGGDSSGAGLSVDVNAPGTGTASAPGSGAGGAGVGRAGSPLSMAALDLPTAAWLGSPLGGLTGTAFSFDTAPIQANGAGGHPVEIDFNSLNMSLPGDDGMQVTAADNTFPTLSP